MSTAPSKLLTSAEYLACERAADLKSEFYRGEMFAMAGANARHNRICVNLVAGLLEQARARGCQVFNSDMRVRVGNTGLYTYPDVSIACGKIEFEDDQEDVLLNPCVIFEVLSKSTERRDRGWKFDKYCELPSMVDYILISHDKALVEHFVRRPDDNWFLERHVKQDSLLKLEAVACNILLSGIYRDIELGPEEVVPPLGDNPL
jgi:Uma2 family endonuclease